ncbi:class II aldolase/adducin family protein [Actinoallomurus sp. NBC_01490]|uniref:class II aldolase/adducin family protein n=1 Tax=Actinoallomurus sp. NBC_01490 TaxID=2903557 RepID=UPI002E337BCE|nr:class II aldolase/adducin family protein [Actinoallomurus sp. NBC_01490]
MTDPRATVAQACRILAMEGLVEGVLGHVSVRTGENRMLIRCRGGDERGLMFTDERDVRQTDLDGALTGAAEGYAVPNELPIHGEVLRARPEVNAVVHAHPPAVLLCGVAGLELRPVFGAYNIPAMRMALEGVPVYRRSVLIRRPDLAHEMIAAMGDRPVCVLKGHGITVTGASVEEAVVRAVNLNALATVTLELARLDARPEDLPDDDVAELPDLGSAFNDLSVWRYLVEKARSRGM